MEQKVVLVVDDEESLRTFLADLLGMVGYQVRTAGGGQQALEMLSGGAFDAVLLDVILPDLSGLEVLRRYRADGGTAPVIVLSALTGADDVVRAMKLGATDYLSKPFNRQELEDALARAFGQPVPVRSPENGAARPAPEVEGAGEDVDGRQLIYLSSAMRRAKALVDQIADTDVPVLLLGESGVGKEVVAREIHTRSRRRSRPFIKVNCAALPAELLESELFGHERGAFTGVATTRIGKFEQADSGTLMMDEIGELKPALQAKLLHVLQDAEFTKLGSNKRIQVDVRVIAATNRDLEKMLLSGDFREDLYYRLKVIELTVPALRERPDEIPTLTDFFVARYSRKYNRPARPISEELRQLFAVYDWPGNIRELENMIKRVVILQDEQLVVREIQRNMQRAAAVLSAVAAPV